MVCLCKQEASLGKGGNSAATAIWYTGNCANPSSSMWVYVQGGPEEPGWPLRSRRERVVPFAPHESLVGGFPCGTNIDSIACIWETCKA